MSNIKNKVGADREFPTGVGQENNEGNLPIGGYSAKYQSRMLYSVVTSFAIRKAATGLPAVGKPIPFYDGRREMLTCLYIT